MAGGDLSHIRNCTFNNNTALKEGAISQIINNHKLHIIQDSTFTNNIAQKATISYLFSCQKALFYNNKYQNNQA